MLSGTDSIIPVAAGVIRRANGGILLARRPEHLDQGGLWEFPGGKREPGESRFQALARELREELNIVPTSALPLIKLRHVYPSKTVELDVWEVLAWDGCPTGAEGQRIAWVEPNDLLQYDFPKANEAIVRAARLPRVIVRIPENVSYQPRFVRQVRNWTASGCLVYGLNFKFVAAFSGAGFDLDGLCLDYGSDELLRTESLSTSTQSRPWTTSRCMNVDELARMSAREPDIIIIESGSDTRPHKRSRSDWRALRDVVSRTTIPVYVGGEVTPAMMQRALAAGCHGIVIDERYWADKPYFAMRTLNRALAALSSNPDALETTNFTL